MKVWDARLPAFMPCSLFDESGAIIHGVFRVEFDGDGNEGMATVSRYEMTESGALVTAWPAGVQGDDINANGYAVNRDGLLVCREPVVLTERRWVKVVPHSDPDADTPVEVRS